MEALAANDVVADPVGHISISGIHGLEELADRLESAPSQDELNGIRHGRGALGTLLLGAAIGAAVMYILDPEGGRRRRALARDKAVRLKQVTTRLMRRADGEQTGGAIPPG